MSSHTSSNGLAERKHRHIVETSLALLNNAKLPYAFWDEATAAYLINRLPSPVLNNLSPFEKLFGKQPNYAFLKVFGCACYPHLRPYNSHKYTLRSECCVFIGYSNKHKGYRCLSPKTGRIFVVVNVIFDESSFPYETLVNVSDAPPTDTLDFSCSYGFCYYSKGCPDYVL